MLPTNQSFVVTDAGVNYTINRIVSHKNDKTVERDDDKKQFNSIKKSIKVFFIKLLKL